MCQKLLVAVVVVVAVVAVCFTMARVCTTHANNDNNDNDNDETCCCLFVGVVDAWPYLLRQVFGYSDSIDGGITLPIAEIISGDCNDLFLLGTASDEFACALNCSRTGEQRRHAAIYGRLMRRSLQHLDRCKKNNHLKSKLAMHTCDRLTPWSGVDNHGHRA
jgi:hypothetical protein